MSKVVTLANRVPMAQARLATQVGDSWRAGKTSTKRGYGYAWQQARKAYLAEHPCCVKCLKELGMVEGDLAAIVLACADLGVPVPYGSVVDHKVPHRGDMKLFWRRSNWQTLCTPHHSSDKQREEHAGRHG
jgi:5-methylcytosine-specific restriction endonuclease McrA